MPRDSHIYTNKSMTQLLKDSGYFEDKESITKDKTIDSPKIKEF